MSGEYQIELVWRCSSCKHQNRGRDMGCANCGNPKDRSRAIPPAVYAAAHK